MSATPAMELRGVSVDFGSVRALQDIDIKVYPGEVHCLLGDNGAGKSTLIKVLSGVYRPTRGQILVDGAPVSFRSPREAQERGVATVFQDLGMISLMSITRNFFLGREPTRSRLPLSRIDMERADRVARQAMADIGIDVRDPTQAVGTLSGGERQSVAIARAVHFGAQGADPRRADLGARRAPGGDRAEARDRGADARAGGDLHQPQHPPRLSGRATFSRS